MARATVAACVRRLRYAVQLATVTLDPREAALYLRLAVEDVARALAPRKRRR